MRECHMLTLENTKMQMLPFSFEKDDFGSLRTSLRFDYDFGYWR
jgi:hypothetical protein